MRSNAGSVKQQSSHAAWRQGNRQGKLYVSKSCLNQIIEEKKVSRKDFHVLLFLTL